MISVGEQTGALDEMLTKIAVFYEAEVDTAVDTLTSIIEPVMIVVMGGIVGGMVVAMYLPMFKLISVVAGGRLIAMAIAPRAHRNARTVPDAWSGLRTADPHPPRRRVAGAARRRVARADGVPGVRRGACGLAHRGDRCCCRRVYLLGACGCGAGTRRRRSRSSSPATSCIVARARGRRRAGAAASSRCSSALVVVTGGLLGRHPRRLASPPPARRRCSWRCRGCRRWCSRARPDAAARRRRS